MIQLIEENKAQRFQGKGKGQSKVNDLDGLDSSIQSVSTNF